MESSVETKNSVKIHKRSGLRVAMDVTAFLATYCFFYCVMLFVVFFCYQAGFCEYEPLLYLPTIIIYFALHELMRRFENPWITGIIGIVFVVGTFFLYPTGNKIWMIPGIILFPYALIEFFTREKKIDKNGIGDTWIIRVKNTAWGIGIVVIMLLHSIISRGNTVRVIRPHTCLLHMSILLCIYIILCVLQRYMKVFHKYFRKKKQINPVLSEQVKKVIITVGCISVVVGIAIFIVSDHMAAILRIIVEPYWEIDYYDYEVTNEELVIEPVYYEDYARNGEVKQSKTSAVVLFLLAKLIIFILVAIAVTVLIHAVIRILKNFARFRLKKQEEENFLDDKREFIVDTKKSKRFKLFKHGDSLNEKVRRYYYKLLLNKKHKGKLKRIKSMTVSDIQKELSETKAQESSMLQLSNIYEKARYSSDTVNKDEVDKAKNLSIDMIKEK